VSQDLADDARIEDEGEDPHGTAAALTERRIDLVDPADEPCPEPTEAAAFRSVRSGIGGRRGTEPLLGLARGSVALWSSDI
jgi:hypothetical protein